MDTTESQSSGTEKKQLYIHRPNIEEQLSKQLKLNGNTIHSVLVSGPRHFGKTTIIKNTLKSNEIPYVYLDFHNKELNNDVFISVLEDNLNDPNWYRILMRKFHPNYHNRLLERWINSVRTLTAELEAKQLQIIDQDSIIKKDETEQIQDEQQTHNEISNSSAEERNKQSANCSIPWIIIDGIDINDVLRNTQLKDDIFLLNQQLCKDFGTASLLLSLSSESPMKSQNLFLDKIDNNIWIGQFESRQSSYKYLKSKLSHLENIHDNELQTIIDFCRLNIDDINFCIEQICDKLKLPQQDIINTKDSINTEDSINTQDSNITETNEEGMIQIMETVQEIQEEVQAEPVTFEQIWEKIKQDRIDFYKNEEPLSKWNDFEFWKGFADEMNDIDGTISKEFELNACKYLLYDYFTSVVVVGTSAKDLIQNFAGNTNIVNDLYCDGCFTQYGSLVIPPFNLFEKSVLMPSSYPKFKSFEQLFKDNPTLSDMALFVSRHYIFTRELNRAKNDIHRIQQEIDIFNAAQDYVNIQKKDLNEDQRAHLEIEILNKTKSFKTKMVCVPYISILPYISISPKKKKKIHVITV